jgi:peptide/nickel transport system substrate-binding protein
VTSNSMVSSSSIKVKMKGGMILFTCLALFALILSACGGGSGSSGTTQGGGTKSSALTIVPSPIGDFAKNFNPYAPSPSYGTQGMIFETLLFFNRLDGSVKPWLASSYQISSDAKTITFNLRQDVKWSNGQPLTADDVVFTLNLLKQYPAADTNNLWGTISAVTSSDSHTVVVTLKQPNAPILWYLGGSTWIVPKSLWSSAGDPTKFTDPNPVGTGPFTLKSFTPQLIDLAKNPNYWQPGKPVISEVRYPSFNSNTSAELLLSRGEVDWTGLFTPNIEKTFVSRDSTHNHYWFPASNVVMLYLNLGKAPFNDLALRKAISYALDRDQMSKVAEDGYEQVAHPTGLILPANKSFLSSDYQNASFALDVAKATQTLDSAGYKKGSDGIYVDKSGKKLSFNLNVVTGWTDWVTICQIMASNLKAIGIDAKVNPIAYNDYYSALQLGSFDMAISWTNPGPTPYFLYNSLLNSKNTAAVGQKAASNFERWSDPTTDKYLQQFASSTDTATQQEAIAGIEKIVAQQLPSIPLVDGATWYEYSSARFTGWPDANNAYAVPSPYTFPDAEVVALNLKPA